MRRPTRLLAALGRRRGRVLQAFFVLLAVVATAAGMDAGSQPSRGAEVRAATPVPDGARPDGPAIDTAKQVTQRPEGRSRRGGAEYYRRTARKRVPSNAGDGFLPLYREAQRTFGVNWRLIASIHRQETAFSTEPSTYRGLNAFGCCAGPMQFNVTNGPPSTWDSYRNAYRAGSRPKRYPNPTRSHPSIYDDFDAIMAAGSLLSDSGAGRSLDGGAWQAAYSYYGHDLFGITYASEVLARAVAWKRDGFCLNCALDEGLVAELDALYGASIRQQMLAAERSDKERTERKKRLERLKKRLERQKERRERRDDADGGSNDPAPQRPPARRPRPSTPPPSQEDTPTRPEPPPPAPPPPSTTPTTPAPAPAPAPAECSSLESMLGC
ncbi:MAG: hypothetical protein H0W03_01290 [Solirubrobacterales bacterium]|nr:hypothetical protein [Solirubrobacterales bacterium]